MSSDEKTRVALLARFIDAVIHDNCGRAVRGEEPMSYEQTRKKWDRIVCASFPKQMAGTTSAMAHDRQKEHAAKRSGSKFGAGGKKKTETPRALYRGGLVCHAYNSATGCGREQVAGSPGGCKTTDGRAFHHVCNFFTSATRKHCFEHHPKFANHK